MKIKNVKEIKVIDYRNIDIAVYKGIFYIYDNRKVYEYLLKNLDEIKKYDVRSEEHTSELQSQR